MGASLFSHGTLHYTHTLTSHSLSLSPSFQPSVLLSIPIRHCFFLVLSCEWFSSLLLQCYVLLSSADRYTTHHTPLSLSIGSGKNSFQSLNQQSNKSIRTYSLFSFSFSLFSLCRSLSLPLRLSLFSRICGVALVACESLKSLRAVHCTLNELSRPRPLPLWFCLCMSVCVWFSFSVFCMPIEAFARPSMQQRTSSDSQRTTRFTISIIEHKKRIFIDSRCRECVNAASLLLMQCLCLCWDVVGVVTTPVAVVVIVVQRSKNQS